MKDFVKEQARDALERFDLLHVTVWLLHTSESTPELAASAGRQKHSDREPTSPQLIRAFLEAGAPRLNGEQLGIPLLAGEQRLGYVEVTARRPITFGVAAQIEAWADELARTQASARATHDLEAPSLGHILLADDEADVQHMLVTFLERRGFKTTAVTNGQLAYERACAEHPDLILLDWMMPILDGRATAERLRLNPETRDIPIIMVTGQSSTRDKVAALEAGAQDYVTKPFDNRELLARIQGHLRWRHLLADVPMTQSAEPIPETPMLPAARPSVQDGEDAIWTAAVQAQQLGRLSDALTLYLEEAERAEHRKLYARAAIAFRSASATAGQLHNLDLSNKFLRLSGKMYLTLAEHSDDSKVIADAYLNATKCFLLAGNLQLAKKSINIAESMNAVMSDDRPSPL
ncbi:MAG: response regulator transcription factor [Vulcanimicrobiaceae bacterium]